MRTKKSLILKFPTEDQVPKELVRHFIRGYFDGDGTNSCFEAGFISTKDFIIDCLKVLSESLNKNSSIKDVHRKDGAKKIRFLQLY